MTKAELATLFSEVVQDGEFASPRKPMSAELSLFIELCLSRVKAAREECGPLPVAPVDGAMKDV